MKLNKIIVLTFLSLSSLVITSCSSYPEKKDPIDSQVVSLNNGNQLTINYRCGNVDENYLKPCYGTSSYSKSDGIRIITPSDKAKNTVGNLVGGLFCITSLGNICVYDGFPDPSKLEGSKLNIEDIIHTYAYSKYIDLIKNNLVLTVKNENFSKSPIDFFKEETFLLYDQTDNDLYALFVNFTIYPYGSRVDKSMKCYERSEKLSKKIWEDNNYEKVRIESKKIIDKCFSKLDDGYFKRLGNHYDHLANIL